MNREILFRGKRTDNREWVYGDLLSATLISKTRIIWLEQISEDDFKEENHEVDPTTIGQFTGLLDKNGNKVFEGDVVFIEDNEGQLNDYVVKWDSSSLCFIGVYNPNLPSLNVYLDELEGCEVIGNIQDNPELIK